MTGADMAIIDDVKLMLNENRGNDRCFCNHPRRWHMDGGCFGCDVETQRLFPDAAPRTLAEWQFERMTFNATRHDFEPYPVITEDEPE